MERERERAVRFSNLEIEVLVNLIKTHIIVEERRIDCSRNAVKRKAWENITAEFWSRTSSHRTEFQLLKKWKNLKHSARKYEAAINSKDYLGRAPPPRSPVLEQVLDIIRREQEVVRNSISAIKDDREIDTTMCLSTKIKVEENDDNYGISGAVDNHQCSEANTIWVQEADHRPAQVVSVSNGIHIPSVAEDMTIESQGFVVTRHSPHIANNLRKRNVVDDDAISTDDVLSVGGCSVASQRINAVGSSMPPELPHQDGVISSGEPCSSSKLVHEKELALKSLQIVILEKENKIKDLDIKLREEQLTDIMIRRKHEQEIHELRKRRIWRDLNDG